MNPLGPQGVADRMAEIGRRLDALSPRSAPDMTSFAQTFNSVGGPNACASNGPLDPAALGPNPISGVIGGSSNDLRTMATDAATRHGIDPVLFHALVSQESDWNPNSTSGAGAKGLCQLMDGTSRDLGVTNPYDPQQSLEGGALFLRRMLDMNHGDVTRALASYNAGFGRVNGRSPGEWPRETQDYVRKILAKAGGIT